MSSRSERLRFAATLSILAGAAAEAFGQCAMCNASVDPLRAGRAFSWSVLFLLGSLFSLIAWLTVLAIRSSRSGH